MFDEFLNSFQMEPGIWPICLRLLCAMLVGMVIGTEREYTNRPAGMRTHILVALGACVVALTGQMLRGEYGNADPARLAAQVITGVGFLGAGTIMKEGVSVKGLTTAASVWAVACLGIACGYGYYALALVGMIFTLITLTVFEALQRKLVNHHSVEDKYTMLCTDVEAVLEKITTCAKDPKITVFDLTSSKEGEVYAVSFRVWFVGRKQEKRRSAFHAALAGIPGVKTVTNASAETKV